MDFSIFDVRKYPTVSVTEGYGEWVGTYEQTVQDEMDLRLLARLPLPWSKMNAIVDLACGTGRIGAWLVSQGASAVEGVDITQEMLGLARDKRVYRRLHQADVTATGLPAGAFDLAIQVLADEHLAELGPLYGEAFRLTSSRGFFVIVGYHPYFLMNGVPTHFDRADGKSVTIRSYVHLTSDHIKAAHAAGWTLNAMEEGVVDDAWVAKKPKWEKYRHTPVSFAMVWRKT